jgi:hypothetical protein
LALKSYFSNLLSDYEKPKTPKTKPKNKKNVNNKNNEVNNKNNEVNNNNENDENNEEKNDGNNEEKNDESNQESNNASTEISYVKIHETSKNEALLLITKRRASILNELLQKIIKKSGAKCNINYISKYNKTNEIIELDLSTIVFKNHGSNNSNNFNKIIK